MYPLLYKLIYTKFIVEKQLLNKIIFKFTL